MAKEKGRIHYGWWVVLGLFFSTFCGAWGRFILTVSGPAISRDTGWSTSEIMLAVTISLLVYSVSVIAVGRLIDKIGGKRVITIGGLLLIIGFALMSFVRELWQLYVVFGFILSVAVSMTHTVPAQSVGRKWFIKRSGLVAGLLIAAFSISTALLAPFITQSAAGFGWRTTFLFAISLGVIIVLFALFVIKDSPESVGLRPYGADEESTESKLTKKAEVNIKPGQALRTVPFWGLCVSFGLISIPHQGITTNLIFWGESVGADPASAGLLMTAFSLPAIFGKIIWGWLGDKFGKRKIMIIGSSLCTLIMIFAWLWVSNIQSLYIMCISIGLSYGFIGLLAPYMGDLFGRQSIGTLIGYTSAAHGFIGAAGPFLWGKIFDISGTYNFACLISAFMYFLMIICYILARPLQENKSPDLAC